MLTKRDHIIKWCAYAAAIALLLGLNTLTLRQIPIWGVRAFLPPIIVGIVASLEEPRSAVVFGLVFGLLCDLTVSAPLPCLYTLSFAFSSLLCCVLARSVLQPGFFCSLAVSGLSFVSVDLLTILTLSLRHHASLLPMLYLATREMAVSALLLPLCSVTLRYVHRRVTI